MELPQRYDFKEAEERWQKYWADEKIHKFDPKTKKNIFSIDTPPPTVSGKMHIGHASMYSQMDFIARYKRMKGFELFYPFGTDDNGLATERLIEKMKKVKGTKMDRDEFIKLCLDTLDEIRPDFVNDWKKIAVSADYDIFYSTINEHCRRLSQKSFIDLYNDGREYRKEAPTIWCPECKTALAQVECEDLEKSTTLNYIKGKMEDGSFIIYATTRPELHPGCVGISIDEEGDYVRVKRPDGEVWVISRDAVEKMQEEFPMEVESGFKGKEIIGLKVTIRYAENDVFVSHDISAKTDYGTGVVYYCSYGGVDCIEWLARHPEAKPVCVMDESSVYIKGPYKGMNSEMARKQILIDLEKEGLLIKKQQMRHVTNVHERCGTPIEYIMTKQWFIRYLDLKDDFLKAGSKLNWHPQFMKHRYDNWVKGLAWDWCISRQRFSGVAFPVWYCKGCGEIILAEEKDLPVDPLKDNPPLKKCPACGCSEFEPEKDVMDTWATSSLTPQIAASMFPEIYDKIYPMDLRPQAHDIITFWLFNTLVKSQLHNDVNPWKDVTISGFVLDPHGKKMSKSKGNTIAPQEVMQKHGADALRFWAASVKLGDDIPFQEKELVAAKKFITKLWNASKFVIMNLEGFDLSKKYQLRTVDRWILSKMSKMIRTCTENFDRYEYSRTKAEAENFFWHTICDHYLEIVKERIYNTESYSEEEKLGAQYTLYSLVLTILKLMAPITPHITEEVYQLYFAEKEGKKSIHTSDWPDFTRYDEDEGSEKLGELLVYVSSKVRQAKSEASISLKEPVKRISVKADVSEKDFDLIRKDIIGVTNCQKIEFEHEKGKAEYECLIEL